MKLRDIKLRRILYGVCMAVTFLEVLCVRDYRNMAKRSSKLIVLVVF